MTQFNLRIRPTFVLGSLLLLGGSGLAFQPAFAQTAKKSTDDEIVVTGKRIRDSQAAAIAAKRDANNIVDILAAETIGRFPDQNLADSLGRVPGLAIERDQGQARFINFRGAPFRYTKISFDGIDVLGAEDGRIPRFDAFPSVVTSKIEINKAVTPDMPGESTVGLINIETFKPFDKAGLSFTSEAGYGKRTLGNVDINKYNGRLSYSNDNFGFVVFGSHNLVGRITDNREFRYTDTNGDDIDDSVVNFSFRSYRGDREDNAFGGRFDLKPTADSTVFFSTLYSDFIDREERNQFDMATTTSPVPLDGTLDDTVLVVTRLLEDGVYRNSTFTNTFGYDGKLGNWDLEARLNYTQTKNNANLPIPYSAGGVVGANVDVTNIETPIINLTQPGQPGTSIDINALDYAATFGLIYATDLTTDAYKAKLDLSRDVDVMGHASVIKFGGQYDTRKAVGGSTLAFGGFPANVDINNFVTDNLWSSDFNNSIAGRNIDNPGLIDAWEQAVGGIDVNFDDDSLIGIDEDVIAVYGMATTEFTNGNIVYGARLERTNFTSSGTLLNDDGSTSAIKADNNYTRILPAAHINFDLNDTMKIRVGGSTGLSRPRYSEVRASQSVDPITLEISGGNPFLDPETSYGVDAAFEWYFARASLFSISAYHREIDNVIYPGSSTVDGSIYAPGLIAAGTQTTFNSFFNGKDGSLSGLEFNILGTAEDLFPAPFDGFGFSGNLTFLDSSFTAPQLGNRKFDLPGTSNVVYNASIFYEKFGFSARVNYQYRGDWLSTTENDSLTEFWAATERVDASLRYEIPQELFGTKVTLALNGNNLTDKRDVRFINRRATPNQVEGFGRRWVASIRVDY